MNNDIQKILVTEEEFVKRAKELGAQISAAYEGKEPLFLGILKGSVPFMGELLRRVTIRAQMDFMAVSSYHGGITSSGEVRLIKDIDDIVEGRDIIIVEDIIDTGRTLKYLRDLLEHRRAASLKIVTLLDKPTCREVEIEADYVGFSIPPEFVVGLGLDYEGFYRNLPYVGVLKPEVYDKNA